MKYLINTEVKAYKKLYDTLPKKLQNDKDALRSIIDSETNLGECLNQYFSSIDNYYDKIGKLRKLIDKAKAAIEKRQDSITILEDAILNSMLENGVKSINLPDGVNITTKATAQKVIGDNVDILPDIYVDVKTNRTPNKAKIKDALNNRQIIEGWTLSNGGQTIQITRSK